MYLDNRSVFLAGGTGLVGSGIASYILKRHPEARIRAAYYKDTRPFIKDRRIEYVSCDLRERDGCRRAVKGCDCAIMAAAFTGGAGLTSAQPWRHIEDNLLMNVRMLEAAQKQGLERLIYIGSATLYQEFNGRIKENKLDISEPPAHPYEGFGWTVRYLEKLCEFVHNTSGMDIVIARASNIFGPYARFDPRTSNFIPALIRKAADKMDPFEVWGSPGIIRDVLYVEDAARAVAMMMNAGKIKFDIFNIGSSTGTPVKEAVRIALKCAGYRPSRIDYKQDRPQTHRFRILDCSKAEKVLGWKPKYSVEEGIEKTYTWWIKNRDRWKR